MNWPRTRQSVAEFHYLNTTDTSDPALIASKAAELAERFGADAGQQARFRAKCSSTAKVRGFWSAVADYLETENGGTK